MFAREASYFSVGWGGKVASYFSGGRVVSYFNVREGLSFTWEGRVKGREGCLLF